VFGERGIVAALVANGVAAVVVFGRETRRGGGSVEEGASWREALRDSKGLLALGAAFLFQNLVLGVGGYWSRVLIMGHGGLDALGLYTAAWTLSGYAVQVILAAMGSDFYPRLTAAAGESEAMNRLVNEQIEMGVLLATPALCGMLTLAPLVLGLVFSRDFSGAVPLVQLMSFGASFRVVAWPIGYIMLARSRKGLFMASEAFGAVCGLVLLAVGLGWWGLNGAGVAGAVSAFLFGVFVWGCARVVTSFRFSRRSLLIVCAHWVVLGVGYGVTRVVSGVPGMGAWVALTAAAVAGSFYGLNRMVGFNAWRALTGRSRRSLNMSL
jgi:PST family polysaccharide transporter